MLESQRTLVFGKDGQLGKAFQKLLSNDSDVEFLGRKDCDLTKIDQIQAVLEKYQPQVILNASAYTAVDVAEKEPELAHLVNAEAPRVMAEYIHQTKGGVLVHYSTDYVFDGFKETPYNEDDATSPLGQYGKSKLAGEIAIQEVFSQHPITPISNYYILRTSWVYGDGGNFIRTMLKLATEREQLKVIADQFGVPTNADWLAQISMHVLEKKLLSGVYHAVPDGETSWYGLAKFAIECAIQEGAILKVKPEAIQAIPAKEYPLPAPRPYNSRMNNKKLKRTLQEDFSFWEMQVRDYVKNMLAK
jgi:dTDP-4-dehydrorhamnose reductase